MDDARQKWLRKNLKADSIRRTLDNVYEGGIKPSLGFIVGYPDETDSEIDSTFSYALDQKCSRDLYMLVSYLQLYPGAPLYEAEHSRLQRSRLAERNNAIIPGHTSGITQDRPMKVT